MSSLTELQKIEAILTKSRATTNVNKRWYCILEAKDIRLSIRTEHASHVLEPYRIVDEEYFRAVDKVMNRIINLYLNMVDL